MRNETQSLLQSETQGFGKKASSPKEARLGYMSLLPISSPRESSGQTPEWQGNICVRKKCQDPLCTWILVSLCTPLRVLQPLALAFRWWKERVWEMFTLAWWEFLIALIFWVLYLAVLIEKVHYHSKLWLGYLETSI